MNTTSNNKSPMSADGRSSATTNPWPTLLHQEYLRRKEKNTSYSLRAFARDLGINSGRLSEYLLDKRAITDQVGKKIISRLNLSLQQKKKFCAALANSADGSKVTQLHDDEFAVISDWWHFAIFALIETQGFRSDLKWMAQRLGLTQVEVRESCARLARLRLIEFIDGRYIVKTQQISFISDIPSEALRHSHRQSLQQAIEKLMSEPVETRDVTSMTIAIDVKKIPQAKTMIKNFRRKLARYLEAGDKTEVYNLNIQLVPVTMKEKP